jgi:hypothetical protein
VLVSEQIEDALGIKLPIWYSELINKPSEFESNSTLELYLRASPNWLIENNKGYIVNINDISDLDDGSLFGSIRRYLLYGSKEKIIKHRKKYYDNWVKDKRFIIGSDGGEEDYFIKLTDTDSLVYVFDLETHKSKLKFKSINEYLEHARSVEEDT